MARIFSVGYELNQVAANSEMDGSPGGGGVNSTVVRSGGFAGRHNPTAGIKFFQHQFAASDVSELYFRFYLRIASAPAANTKIFRVQNTGSTDQVSIQLKTDLTLQAQGQGGSSIGSPSSALSLDTWYRIEVYAKDASAGGGTAEFRIDGVAFASQTDTTPDIDGMAKYDIGILDSTTADIYTDDFGVNDTTGSFQNSWLGEGEIIHLRPNAAGDNSDWNLQGAASAHQTLDEVGPNDATDYIYNTSLNFITDVNLDATPAALDSSDVIGCVQVGVRFRASTTVTGYSIVLRIKASSGGTVEESAGISPTSATWFTHSISVPRVHHFTLYDLPGASTTSWTKSDLDAAQLGVKQSADNGTDNVQVSTLWLLVDHAPSAGSPETADVSPVVSTFTVPSTTATYQAVISAGVQPVSSTFTVESVTATYIQINTASVSPVTSTFTVAATTATYAAVITASVSPVQITFTVPVTTGGSLGAEIADVSPVIFRFTVIVPTFTGLWNFKQKQESSWNLKPRNLAPQLLLFQNGDIMAFQNGDQIKTHDGPFDWNLKTKQVPDIHF